MYHIEFRDENHPQAQIGQQNGYYVVDEDGDAHGPFSTYEDAASYHDKIAC